MPTEFRIRIMLASILGCLLLFSPQAQAAGDQPLGRVLYSYRAALGTVSVPKPETIFSGDVLSTAPDGSALVEFDSGGRVRITENTSVRFLRDEQRILVQLQSGAVITETSSTPTIIVGTPKYHFEAAHLGDCRYLVQLSKEQATTAAAMKGNVLIRSNKTSSSYLLHEGSYAAIDADASGIPPQPGSMSSRSQPVAAQGRHGGWRIGSLSNGESIALELGIVGGAAAGIAIPLSRSGAAAASPSVP